MRKVYESLDYLMIGHLKNLLANEGIPSVTRNEYLASAAGRIPQNECWYEIWVIDESQYNAAEGIIKGALSKEDTSGPEWICPGCGEKHEHQFSECWQCGKGRS